MSPPGAKVRQASWQSSVQDSGSSAVTQTYCVCSIQGVTPDPANGTWGRKGTNAAMKSRLPAVLWVIKSLSLTQKSLSSAGIHANVTH